MEKYTIFFDFLKVLASAITIFGAFKFLFDKKVEKFKISIGSISGKYDIKYELVPILLLGIVLNYFGLLIAEDLRAILFLDMIGTALVAILLGPWYGAITGLVTNGFLSMMAYPTAINQNPWEMIYPWVLVNILGGIYWGFCGKSKWFKDLIDRKNNYSTLDYIILIVSMGVIASFVMNLPGGAIHLATGVEDRNIPYGNMSGILVEILKTSNEDIDFLNVWLLLSIYSIPDKLISFALAIMIIRIGFPFFEHFLILGGRSRLRMPIAIREPILFAIIYLPFLFTFWVKAEDFNFYNYWFLWSFPLILSLLFIPYHLFNPQPKSIEIFKMKRIEMYEKMQQVYNLEHFKFVYRNTTLVVVVSVIFLLVGLPWLYGGNLYGLLSKLTLLILSSLSLAYLFRTGIAHNAFDPIIGERLSEIKNDAILKVLNTKASKIRRSSMGANFQDNVKVDGKSKKLIELNGRTIFFHTDNGTAFDRRLNQKISLKGIYAKMISSFWLSHLPKEIPTHYISEISDKNSIDEFIQLRSYYIKKLNMFPYEFVVRKRLFGSAYSKNINNEPLGLIGIDKNLKMGDVLDTPIITHTSKKISGVRRDVSRKEIIKDVGEEAYDRICNLALTTFDFAYNAYLATEFELCDSKFEFGRDDDGNIILGDELFTPDSSRFVIRKDLEIGLFKHWDKQILEDYLSEVNSDPSDIEIPEIPKSIRDEYADRFKSICDAIVRG